MSFASYPQGGPPCVQEASDGVSTNNSTSSYTTKIDLDVSKIGGPMMVTVSAEVLSKWNTTREVLPLIRVDTQVGSSWTDRNWPYAPSSHRQDSGGADVVSYVPVTMSFYVDKADRVRLRFRSTESGQQVSMRYARIVAVGVSPRA